MQKGSTVFTG